MRIDYDDLSWDEYLRSIDESVARIDCDAADDVVDSLVEWRREEYRLAWYDYVDEFE